MSATTNGKPFSTKVFSELKRQGLGIRTLARRMDPEHPERARRNLNRWLHEGIRPSPANRIAVAVALGIREDEFSSDEDDEEDAELHAALAQLTRVLLERVRFAADRERVEA